jgi:hypothetical protein
LPEGAGKVKRPPGPGAIDAGGGAGQGAPRREPAEDAMATKLHLVFGGELVDPSGTTFKDVKALDIVGIYPNYAAAYEAWKSKAQQTVDNAHMRYFIAHLHRLRDEEQAQSAEIQALER